MSYTLRNLLSICTIALSAATMAATEAPVHRFANFNIRYVNPSNGDTGSKHWSERGQYVVQIIKDYDFDVVGLEEVTGLNGGSCVNPATGRSQLEDLKAWLPDYTIMAWERSGNDKGKDYSHNAIAFKTDKYEVLDSGCFWLRGDYKNPGSGWDKDPQYSGIWRTCCWEKLKVKATGEIFFFSATHVNYGPSLDGINSGNTITKVLSDICGDYPVVLVGDFNMRRTDHATAYRNYITWFNDAALTSPENYCLPTTNPSCTVTTNNWSHVGSDSFKGSEFDFIFYRNMTPVSRHIITEDYGRDVTPSDHFPLLFRAVLREPQAPAVVCVSPGAAAGDGSADKPFGSLSEALEGAEVGTTVRIAEGTLSEGVTIPASITIEGGYNSDFTAVTGRTTLDGKGSISPIINVTDQYALTLRDLDIKGALSTKSATDGAVRYVGSHLVMERVTCSDNTSVFSGGAIHAEGGELRMTECVFSGNNGGDAAGAVSADMRDNVSVTRCIFSGNTAKNGSAMTVYNAGGMLMKESSFIGNHGERSGALQFTGCSYNGNYMIVNSTFANNTLAAPSGLATLTRKFGGAAIYAEFSGDAELNMAHLTVTGNTATFAGSNNANFGGAAIRVISGTTRLVNSIVAGNYADGDKADVNVDAAVNVVKEMNNVYTTDASAVIKKAPSDTYAADYAAGITATAGLLNGTVGDDGRFTANVTDVEGATPVVYLNSKKFGDKAVNTLSSFTRMIEAAFGKDIDGDGKVGGTLNTDQLGAERASNTVPGAVEYVEGAGVAGVAVDSDSAILPLGGHRYSVAAPATVYAPSGAVVASFAAGTADLSGLTPGMYIIISANHSLKVVR